MLRAMDPAERIAFCRRLLAAPDLAGKLAPPNGPDPAPPAALPAPTPAPEPEVARPPLRPMRGPGLEMTAGAARLPRPAALATPRARATALARFAHHELQAAELFAWAILRWPRVPEALANGWLGVLADEQRHARLYLERVEALGWSFASFAPHSDYLWKPVAALDAAPDGPSAFLAAMGLTLEQANLDFSALYRDAFAAAGDDRSAAVCAAVFEDEVGHVRLAASWLRRLRREASDAERYRAVVPAPLGLARAKGRRFQTRARERAGLDAAFIEAVRSARSTQERRPGRHRD